ncbi:hypothetical protein GTP46_11370 [Duganella sp. FT135W]|uniref:Uncharacterized protein n=1 Tax=Duganella flavida TaxID=2692175 RepID=A0A6L8K880_9BURK|nr:hypothetical protein [Duganella flavida]MYM23245.1 hypothetical protein [Duganella flavida]
MMKSNKVKAKEKSVIETLESLQAMAAKGQLSGALMADGIPKLASPTNAKPKRFSQLIPFERSTLDYEMYCTSLAADSMEPKLRKE